MRRHTRWPGLMCLLALCTLMLVNATSVQAVPPSPRVLPPTFVKLQVAQFPRPAYLSCRDNTKLISVPSPVAPTIARAISQATPGSTIRVRAGTYVENAGSYFALDLSTSNVCVRGFGGAVTLRAAPGQNYGLILTGSDISIQGIAVRGFAYNVSLGAGHGLTQRRITLEDMSIAAAGEWLAGGGDCVPG